MHPFVTLLGLSAFLTCPPLVSANYITLSDRYTADPAPFVHDGRLYIFTSHDLDTQEAWLMTDYSCMSSDDLQNWRDEGIVFTMNNITWGKYAWAQQVIAGNDGKFYMYFPGMQTRNGSKLSGTGVAVSASVTGPYLDAIGHPLLSCGDDPTVFRDDDGQVYFCGNCGGPLCAKLAPNMTSLQEPPALLSPPLPNWFEAPWLSKWKGTYYLSYMCKGNGQEQFSHYGWDICYGSCSGPNCSPLGPYIFRGSLMWSPPYDCGPVGASCDGDGHTGENNHQGIVEFPEGSGTLYFAYHSRTLSKSRGAYLGYQRNVAIDRLYSRGDATTYPLPSIGLPWAVNDTVPGAGPGLLPVTSTPSWVRQLAYVDPYTTPIPAVLSSLMSPGLNSEPCSEGGLNLGFITNGATVRVTGVDFGGVSPPTLTFRAATPVSGGAITVIADGRVVTAVAGGCVVPNTGDWQVYQDTVCSLTSPLVGVVNNLTLVFTGVGTTGLFNLKHYVFNGGKVGGSTPPPVTKSIAIKSRATGLYWEVVEGGNIYPNSSTPVPFTVADQQDGTWTLGGVVGGGGEGLVCVQEGGGVVLKVGALPTDPCTRLFLYGTPAVSYGILGAQGGFFVFAGAPQDGLTASQYADPRDAPGDGARHFLVELI